MIRYAEILRQGLAKHYRVSMLSPAPFFARALKVHPNTFLGKWIAYVDKYIFFPLKLFVFARNQDSDTVYHICDHSNSVYERVLKRRAIVLTCHDVLAIRGAFGDSNAWCTASYTGKILQTVILASIKRTTHVVSVSQATKNDLQSLGWHCKGHYITVIHNCIDPSFSPISESEISDCLTRLSFPKGVEYLLYVGSALPRKNRNVIFRALAASKNQDLILIIAGAALTSAEKIVIMETGMSHRIHVLSGVSDRELQSLYRRAFALVFPSFSEGFGWPIIEAQALSCPVICSNRTSLPEVAGSGAILTDPTDFLSIAKAIDVLADETFRQKTINLGLENLSRFSEKEMLRKYIQVYKAAIQGIL